MNNSTSKSKETQVLDKLLKEYRLVSFATSAAKCGQLPPDHGFEVAIAGRSNAGKSTFLNTLTGQKSLAKTSKTPGRTQLMNVFNFRLEEKRLVDLPGYGFAKVAQSTKFDWETHLGDYLQNRQSLRGVILLMDSRHPLQELDLMMITSLIQLQLPVHILLTKADKLSKSAGLNILHKVQKNLAEIGLSHCLQLFSIHKPETLKQVVSVLDEWLEMPTASA